MGIDMENAIVNQLKKGQGEQNERLERLIAQQIKTNDLLEELKDMEIEDQTEYTAPKKKGLGFPFSD